MATSPRYSKISAVNNRYCNTVILFQFHGKLEDGKKLTNDDILEYEKVMNHQRSKDAEYAKLPKISGFPALNPTMISIDSNGVVRTSETGKRENEKKIIPDYRNFDTNS